MGVEYAIIVKNKTRLELLIERFNTKAQAKFYVESMGGNFEDYVAEHDTFHNALDKIQSKLTEVLKNKIVERAFLPNYLFTEKNIIVVVGQDGLVANTAKYSMGLPIVAINPDKQRYDGILLPFDSTNFIIGIENVLKGTYSFNTMRFAEATLNDGQSILAFNDLFIGNASHVSSRYKISFNQQNEEQSSSGIIVSTKAGMTGWMSSIFNMAYGVTGLLEKHLSRKRPTLDENCLLFVVREAFQSIRTQIDISTGIINEQTILKIESLMPTNGVIFSDGIENDFLKFTSGMTATIGLANKKAVLVTN